LEVNITFWGLRILKSDHLHKKNWAEWGNLHFSPLGFVSFLENIMLESPVEWRDHLIEASLSMGIGTLEIRSSEWIDSWTLARVRHCHLAWRIFTCNNLFSP
jgi:hypothetical protein